jgi:hypothetical protein
MNFFKLILKTIKEGKKLLYLNFKWKKKDRKKII